MTKKDEIISIDLDEEEEKKVKKQEIEIKAGDLFIHVPADRSRIGEAIEVLRAFEEKISRPAKLKEIEKEIQETKQFLENTEKKEKEIEEKIEPKREEETILNEGKRYIKCPVCSGKLKKKKIQQFEDGFVQEIRCKNRKCKWRHIYKIAI